MAPLHEAAGVLLTTPRLILREFRPTDEPAIHAYASDPQVTRFTSWGPNTPQTTASVLRNWLETRNHTPRLEWPIAIVRRSDGQLIGGTGIHHLDRKAANALFGYVLQRAAWGHGFATEAGSAVLPWAFDQLRLNTLTAHCEPSHRASVNVLHKLGFHQNEGLSHHERANGEIRPYLTFLLRRPD